MTCYIAEESRSSLREGIETIVIPIHDPDDMEQLVFHTQRGGVYDVVEWLLSELYRSTELERVVGLTVTPTRDQVIVNLELRQPGKQMEEWLAEHRVGRYQEVGSDVIFSDSSYIEKGPVLKLSSRSLGKGKFTDQYKPWWENQVENVVSELGADTG